MCIKIRHPSRFQCVANAEVCLHMVCTVLVADTLALIARKHLVSLHATHSTQRAHLSISCLRFATPSAGSVIEVLTHPIFDARSTLGPRRQKHLGTYQVHYTIACLLALLLHQLSHCWVKGRRAR